MTAHAFAWVGAVVAAAVLTTLATLVTGVLWRVTGQIARLPAAVDQLTEAVAALATVPHRVDRLEAVVFPNGVPA